jgi:hypothetical protein
MFHTFSVRPDQGGQGHRAWQISSGYGRIHRQGKQSISATCESLKTFLGERAACFDEG